MTDLKVYLTVTDPVGQTAFFELTYAQLLLNLSLKLMRKVPLLLLMSLCEYYLAMGSFQLFDYLKEKKSVGILGGVLRENIAN